MSKIDRQTVSVVLKLLKKAYKDPQRPFKKEEDRDAIINELFRRQGIDEIIGYIENIEENGISFAKELLKD